VFDSDDKDMGWAWEDLLLIGVARVGGTAPSFENFNSTGVYAWKFSKSAANELHFQTQIPHSLYKHINFHMHVTGAWTTLTNRRVVIEMRILLWKGDGGVSTTGYGTSNYLNGIDMRDNAYAYENQQHSLTDFDMSNLSGNDFRPSACLAIVFRRLGNDGSDNLDEDLWLTGLDVHYQINGQGGQLASFP
jgi:hypothetical protein